MLLFCLGHLLYFKLAYSQLIPALKDVLYYMSLHFECMYVNVIPYYMVRKITCK